MSHTNHLSEQEILRRNKLAELEKLGINAYPAETFEVNVSAREILDNYENQKIEYKNVSIAGRLMSVRDMGKACFLVIQDATTKIQVYLRGDDICPGDDKTLYAVVFKK
ncbi:MAG: lysine--tRNA ligase, partial [Bacteroidetes bacterium]